MLEESELLKNALSVVVLFESDDEEEKEEDE
jgi:hypothetical protein